MGGPSAEIFSGLVERQAACHPLSIRQDHLKLMNDHPNRVEEWQTISTARLNNDGDVDFLIPLSGGVGYGPCSGHSEEEGNRKGAKGAERRHIELCD